MKHFTIEVEDTTAAFLDYVSKSNNVSIERIISDLVFKHVSNFEEIIINEFITIDERDKPHLL